MEKDKSETVYLVVKIDDEERRHIIGIYFDLDDAQETAQEASDNADDNIVRVQVEKTTATLTYMQ